MKCKWKKEKSKKVLKTAYLLSFLFIGIIHADVFLASTNAVMAPFQSFETLLTDLISTLGTIYTLWGVSEWGLAWNESNGSANAQSFKRIFGGIVVALSPQIMAVLV